MPAAIDAHVHVWTDDRAKYPRAFEQPSYKPDRFNPEDLFRHSRPLDVRRIVLIQMSFYRFDNSYMLDQISAYPGVFSGVGIVDSNASTPERKMLELARRGVRGFRIVPDGKATTWLDTPGMQAMWKMGADKRLAMCGLIGPDALPSVDRMCAKFPDTPVVIDHLARIGSTGTVSDEDVRALCRLAKHRNVTVKASAFYALGKKQAPYADLVPLIRRVFEDFGPRRLMWASDSPFQVEDGHRYASSLELVRDRLPFLSAEDKSWMLEKTAASVFFNRV
jgi:predicted TIM-barrel fold metal-dependent hydrolase